VPEPLPPWERLEPGLAVTLGGVGYAVTDRREAEGIAGEGGLPFRVGSGWKTLSADLRNETARFATLDYSDETPRLYLGEVIDDVSRLRAGAPRAARAARPARVRGRALTPPPAATTLACRGCGGTLEIRAPGRSVTVACG